MGRLAGALMLVAGCGGADGPTAASTPASTATVATGRVPSLVSVAVAVAIHLPAADVTYEWRSPSPS